MKKFNLSLVALLAMSTFAMAGGDIAPVEPMVETPMVEESTPGAFYLGLAYGMGTTEMDASFGTEAISIDIDHDTVMLQAGYKFNEYLAVEGRYWLAATDADIDFSYTDSAYPLNNESWSESMNDDSSAWGIYLKPMYPVTEAFDVYALLGYGNVELDLDGASSDDSGFQWGIGAAYAFSDNVAVFVDYVSMYDDNDNFDGDDFDITVDTWNFGVTYTF